MTGTKPDAAHRVLALQVRPAMDAPTEPRAELNLVAGQGVEGDHSFGGRRHVTIVFEDDWKAALAAHGREVPWTARRANVFVSGGNGARLVGTTMRLGPATVEIHGLVAPCPVMDKASDGLQEALKPDGRAGIWGRVVEGGVLRPGMPLASSGS
jgi:MOSC domain-containing protein YiiM